MFEVWFFLREVWGKLPRIAKTGIIIIVMLILGDRVPWKAIFGDMGGYIQAGMILGAVFLIIKVFKKIEDDQAKAEGSTNEQ